MKTLLKTLIGGALGVGALYVVGKICYEAGKDVAEVERQLSESKSAPEKDIPKEQGTDDEDYSNPINGPLTAEKAETNSAEEPGRKSFFGKTVDKIKNAKIFLAAKKAFSKGGRSPGILGSLLTNPDGARIEACVKDGGVQINVTPKTA